MRRWVALLALAAAAWSCDPGDRPPPVVGSTTTTSEAPTTTTLGPPVPPTIPDPMPAC